jgi:hypothetical protein
MHQAEILYPMAALAMLTFAVLLVVPYRRFKAAFARQVRADDFKYGESKNVPPEVAIPNRNYMNLLEMPLLFYVACITLYVTKSADRDLLYLAWGYFALRLLHSAVHLSYNKVMHRLTLFALSNVVLAVIWVRILSRLSAGSVS